MVEAAAAGPCQLEPDLQTDGLGLGTVLALVDLLGLKALEVLLWAPGEGEGEGEAPAPAGLSLGRAGPEHLSSPVGRNGLGYAPQAHVVCDWRRFADKKLGSQLGPGYTSLQDFPDSD